VTSSAGTTNLTYDFESRVTQISGPGINASYSYNGLDTRVGKTENSVSNTFRRSGAYVTDPVLSDGTASYTPGVSRCTGTETRYFHTGLKNTDSLTNPGQTVAASRIYHACGNVMVSSCIAAFPFGSVGRNFKLSGLNGFRGLEFSGAGVLSNSTDERCWDLNIQSRSNGVPDRCNLRLGKPPTGGGIRS
jgi:hypothetical protein